MASKPRKIRAPLSRVMRSFMRAFAPVLAWFGAMGLLAYLGASQFRIVDAVGVLESQVAAVVPIINGKIESIGVAEFDYVEAGQALVALDDAVVEAERKTAQAQIAQLRAELEAAVKEIERQRMTDLRRFEIDEETARLDLLDRIVELEEDKAELARVKLLLSSQSRLVEQGIVARQTFEDLTIQEAALETRIDESQNSITCVRQQIEDTARRKEAYLASNTPATSDVATGLLAPIREDIFVQQAEVDRLTELMDQHILRAPISGVVTLANTLGRSSMPTGTPTISGQPGENVMAGVPLMEITNPQTGRVNAWIEEGRLDAGIREGAVAQVMSRRNPREIAEGNVVNVGARIEQFPLRADPTAMPPKWGLRVVIGQVPIQGFLPGEVVDIRFLPDPTADSGFMTRLLSKSGLIPSRTAVADQP